MNILEILITILIIWIVYLSFSIKKLKDKRKKDHKWIATLEKWIKDSGIVKLDKNLGKTGKWVANEKLKDFLNKNN